MAGNDPAMTPAGRTTAFLRGFILGPLLGGWLYDSAGHAFPFYLNGAALFAAAALVWLLLGRQKRP